MGIVACKEDNPVNNNNDKVVYENLLEPSNSVQTIETIDGIKIIIPAAALQSSLNLKITKLASPPSLNDATIKIGSNVFKLELIGDIQFSKSIVIRVKFDVSKILSGITISEGVKGLMYYSGEWQTPNYTLDLANEEIVFLLDPINKVSKNSDKFLSDEEIVFGDGYTTTDSGQSDELLNKMKYFMGELYFEGYVGDDNPRDLGFQFDNLEEESTTKINWNGNKFHISDTSTAQYGYQLTNITGEVIKGSWDLQNLIMHCIIFTDHGTYTSYEDYYVEFNSIDGDLIDYGANLAWLDFHEERKDYTDENNNEFQKAVKSIDYFVTLTELNGDSETLNLTAINWGFDYGSIRFWFYQSKN